MPETDHDYIARRALEEREAAARATSEPAQRSHKQLAERYAKAAEDAESAGREE